MQQKAGVEQAVNDEYVKGFWRSLGCGLELVIYVDVILQSAIDKMDDNLDAYCREWSPLFTGELLQRNHKLEDSC